MDRRKGDIYDFDDFRLIPGEGLLLHNGEQVSLPPKAFSTLVLLVKQHGHLVEKTELIESIWDDAFVEESAVSRCVWDIRKALGEDPKNIKFIQTVSKRGYRFVSPVNVLAEGEGSGILGPSRSQSPGILSNGNGSATTSIIVGLDPFLSTGNIVQNGNHEWKILSRPRLDELPGQAAALNTGPERRFLPIRRRPLFIAVSALVFLLFGLSAIYLFSKGQAASGPSGRNRIAVLPLKPVNVATRDSIYELGIADSVILKISTSRNLIVRQLHAVRNYVELDRDLIEIGNEQNVDFILASNYQIANGRIKVTSQLLDVASGKVQDTYTVEMDSTDLFAAQDAIAGSIGSRLIARFGGSFDGVEPKRGTISEEAYRLYLQGMYLVEKGDKAGTKRSIELFEQAIILDPNFAAAWAGKGLAHCAYSHMGDNSPANEYEIAGPAIERALELDRNLAEAYAVLGIINTDFRWNFAEGEKHFLHAIDLNPSSDYAYRWYGNRLVRYGRTDEAVAAMKTAIDNNPTNIFHHRIYGWVLYLARHNDEAIKELERVVEMDPSFVSAYDNLWLAYNAKGDHERAFEWFMKYHRQAGTSSELINRFNLDYKKSGWLGVLQAQQAVLKTNEKKGTFSPEYYRIATLSALVGDNDRAMGSLNEAFKYRSADITFLKTDPALDSLRGEPRFDELLRRAGF